MAGADETVCKFSGRHAHQDTEAFQVAEGHLQNAVNKSNVKLLTCVKTRFHRPNMASTLRSRQNEENKTAYTTTNQLYAN